MEDTSITSLTDVQENVPVRKPEASSTPNRAANEQSPNVSHSSNKESDAVLIEHDAGKCGCDKDTSSVICLVTDRKVAMTIRDERPTEDETGYQSMVNAGAKSGMAEKSAKDTKQLQVNRCLRTTRPEQSSMTTRSNLDKSAGSTTSLRQLEQRIGAFKRAHAVVINSVKESTCPDAVRIRESDRLSWDWLPSLGLFTGQSLSDRKRFVCDQILKPGALVEGVVHHASDHTLELDLTSVLLLIGGCEQLQASSTARGGAPMVGRRPIRINDLGSLEIQASVHAHTPRDTRLSIDEQEEQDLYSDCRRHDTVRGVVQSVQHPQSDTPRVLLRFLYDRNDGRINQIRLGRVRNEEKNFNIDFEEAVSFNAHCEKVYDFHNPKLTEEMRSVLALDSSCDTMRVPTGRHTYADETCVDAIRSKQNQQLAHSFVAKAVAVLKAKGDTSKCHQYLNEALSVNPNYIEALVVRGAVNIQNNKLDAAIVTLRGAVKQNTLHKNAVKYLCAALTKRAKGCMESHRSRVASTSSDTTNKALERAMGDLQEAHQLAPDDQEISDLLKLAQNTKFEAIQQEANRKKALLRAAMSALEKETREKTHSHQSDKDFSKKKAKRKKRSKSRTAHRKRRKRRVTAQSSSDSSGSSPEDSDTSSDTDNSATDSSSDGTGRDHRKRKRRKRKKERHKSSRRR